MNHLEQLETIGRIVFIFIGSIFGLFAVFMFGFILIYGVVSVLGRLGFGWAATFANTLNPEKRIK